MERRPAGFSPAWRWCSARRRSGGFSMRPKAQAQGAEVPGGALSLAYGVGLARPATSQGRQGVTITAAQKRQARRSRGWPGPRDPAGQATSGSHRGRHRIPIGRTARTAEPRAPPRFLPPRLVRSLPAQARRRIHLSPAGVRRPLTGADIQASRSDACPDFTERVSNASNGRQESYATPTLIPWLVSGFFTLF